MNTNGTTRSLRKFQTLVVAVVLAITTACATAQPAPTPTLIPPTPVPPLPTAVPATATAVPATPTSPPAKGTIEQGTITSAALAHNLIGDPATRTYHVYLPPGYDTSGQRYPVVYVLQGMDPETCAPINWVTGGGGAFLGIPTYMDYLLGTGAVKPMILVFPDATNAFGFPVYMSSPTLGDYDTYITKELVAQIDSTYRTLPTPASRGIMGGVVREAGSLHLSLEHPDVFGVSASIDPMLSLPNDPMAQFAAGYIKALPQTLADLPREANPCEPFGFYYAQAAAAASDPGKPPLYIDMPFKMVNGKGEIDPAVFAKIDAAFDVASDAHRYASQSARLNGLLIYFDSDPHSFDVGYEPAGYNTFMISAYRSYDQLLTQLGINHDLVQYQGDASTLDLSVPLKFISAHLAFQ